MEVAPSVVNSENENAGKKQEKKKKEKAEKKPPQSTEETKVDVGR